MKTKRFQKDGVLNKAELKRKGLLPPLARLKKGPVVVVECVENIPCNPCAYACPHKAITIAGNLTDTPQVDFEKCNGCGLCIARCPGLAVFVVNLRYNDKEATVTLPYELLPRPELGERVLGLDRAGKKVCDAKVVKVLDTKVQDRCAVVTVAVPKRFWNEVRNIQLRRGGRWF
ncbi:MAG: NADH-quinone oxidoreductase subunit I [bacterium]